MSQENPVTMAARRNRPAWLTSRGCWLKPAPNRPVVVSMDAPVAWSARPEYRGAPSPSARLACRHRFGQGVMAMAAGAVPALIVLPGVLVAVRMGVTVSAGLLKSPMSAT